MQTPPAASSLRWAKRLTTRSVDMAIQAAVREQRAVKFLLMDNQAMNFQKQFHLLSSVESASQYQNGQGFFGSAANC